MARFLDLSELKVATLDHDATERWFTRRTQRVFLYAEAAIEVASGITRQPRCEALPRQPSDLVDRISVILWQQGRKRTVLELGRSEVTVNEDRQERGTWNTFGVGTLPYYSSAWDDEHAQYSEGAALYEAACVPSVRTVPCGAEAGPSGYCIDRDLVIRAALPKTVRAAGKITLSSFDPPPDLPAGECVVQCEPSACDEAVRREVVPQAPLYAEDASVLAVFKSQAACRAFAAARAKRVRQ